MAAIQLPDKCESVHGPAQHQIRNDKIDGMFLDAIQTSRCVGSGPNMKFRVVKDRAEKPEHGRIIIDQQKIASIP